jgi:DNA repair exonuclease SbcCD ATPase subunit
VSDVDDLFKLPPDEFTAARNALVTQLKKGGRADEAAEVKSLSKPPISAWTVNQLFWRHRKLFDQFMAAGEKFRKAQASQLAGKGTDLRAPLEERREALAQLTKAAAKVLQDSGHPASPDLMRRIATTLEAVATYGAQENGPALGRLTDDIDAPGFEALAALVPRAGGGRGAKGSAEAGAVPRVIPFEKQAERRSGRKKDPEEEARRLEEERKAQLAAAKAALQEAERSLRDSRKAAVAAEAALKKAAARAKETERVKEDLEKKFEKASADADTARQEARRVASQAEEAAQAVEDAERALEKAKRELQEF